MSIWTELVLRSGSQVVQAQATSSRETKVQYAASKL
jgi:hypothetical protein